MRAEILTFCGCLYQNLVLNLNYRFGFYQGVLCMFIDANKPVIIYSRVDGAAVSHQNSCMFSSHCTLLCQSVGGVEFQVAM